MALNGVSQSYNGVEVLSGLNVEFRSGRVGLIGVNGAGKSTLLRILTTAQSPTSGSISWSTLGETLSEARRKIGYMPQYVALPRGLRVLDFMAYMAWLKAVPRTSRRGQIDGVLEQTELASKRSARVGELSGGMYRRLLLAQALLGNPTVLVLDEPTAGLDPEQRVNFRHLIFQAGSPSLVIISSHTIEDLAPVVDRVLMLDRQSLVFDDGIDELRGLGEQYPIPGMSTFESAFVRLRTVESRS